MIWTDWVLIIPAALILNGVLGPLAFFIWMALERIFEKRFDVQFLYILLKFTILFWAIPFLVVLQLISSMIHGYYRMVIPMMLRAAAPLLYVCFFVWLVGFTYQTGRLILRARKLKHLFRGCLPADFSWQETLSTCRIIVGYRKSVDVRVHPALESPLVRGIFHPVIYVPMKSFSGEVRQILLLHELKHIESRDLWWKQLAAFLRCIYWFIPLVELVGERLDSWAEFHCDCCCGYLLGDMKGYFSTLLSLGISQERCVKAGWATAFYQDKNQLIQRLQAVKSNQRMGRRRGRWITAVASIFLILTGTSVMAATHTAISMYQVSWETNLVMEEDQPNAPMNWKKQTGDWSQLFPGESYQDQSFVTQRSWTGRILGDGSAFERIAWQIPPGMTAVSHSFTPAAGEELYLAFVADLEETPLWIGTVTEEGHAETEFQTKLWECRQESTGDTICWFIRNESACPVYVEGFFSWMPANKK